MQVANIKTKIYLKKESIKKYLMFDFILLIPWNVEILNMYHCQFASYGYVEFKTMKDS